MPHRLPFPRSISDRIMAPYVALALASVGGTALACASWAGSQARTQFLERGRGIAQTLARSSFPWTGPVLGQLKGLGGAEFVLLSNGGQLLASTLSPSASDVRALAANLPRPPDSTSFEREWTSGGERFRVSVLDRPTDRGGPSRLVILLPEAGLNDAARDASRAAIVPGLVAAVIAAWLASRIAAGLSRPLSAVLDAIRQVGRGDLEPTGLPIGRSDEIGELAEGVAQMAGWLRKLQDEQARTHRLQLIQQVSAGLAHELRNPLTAARMTLQIDLERNPRRDDQPVRIALDELARMERQVKRFLQIARPEPQSIEPVDPGALLERCAASLAATASHQGILLDVELADDLALIQGDADQLAQVVTNLAGNALDATGPGGRVTLAASMDAGQVCIDVLDSGPGVPEGSAGRIFEPFFTTKPEGVGLGLALCAALVREHGGTIGYSRVGGRTRFRVGLPATAPMEKGDATAWPT
ncbi:HAMP domain-containing sensor histidine kinase [Isosphaeraceae bacterium EP7]